MMILFVCTFQIFSSIICLARCKPLTRNGRSGMTHRSSYGRHQLNFALFCTSSALIKTSQGFTDVGLYRILESIRAYMYLILSLQASVRSCIIEHTASLLTAQKAFLNTFENVVNCRVDIREDMKCYQDTLSYVLSKVDYSVEENVYMLPSNMNLNIRSGTAGYNNKIFVSNCMLSFGRNKMVNTSVPEKTSHKKSIPCAKGGPQRSPIKTHISHHARRGKCFGTCSSLPIWNMVCFSLMRGTRQGNPTQAWNLFL